MVPMPTLKNATLAERIAHAAAVPAIVGKPYYRRGEDRSLLCYPVLIGGVEHSHCAGKAAAERVIAVRSAGGTVAEIKAAYDAEMVEY